MRKLLLLSFIALVGSYSFIACNDEIGDEITQKIAEPTSDYYQPYDSALAIALRLLNDCYPGTRSHIQRTVKEHYVYSPSPSTRATETDPVRFHVINFENGQGFAIVSADKRTTPVYAYSSTGNIDLQDAIQYSGVGEFMECAELYFQDEIERFGGGPLTPFEPDSSLIDLMVQVPVIVDGIECVQRHVTVQDNKNALMSTAWDQLSPYNIFCPSYTDSNGFTRRYPAGCGPIAIGQIMAYHKYPAAYGAYTFNWPAICSASNVSPNDTCKARLINVIWTIAGMTNPEFHWSTVPSVLSQLGYAASQSTNYSSSDDNNIKSNIKVHRPVLFKGESSSSGATHAWVVDGYHSTKHQTIYYYAYFPYPEYKTVTNSETIMFHCNFGEGGLYNGYFLNVYNDTYSTNVKYIDNIRPNSNN